MDPVIEILPQSRDTRRYGAGETGEPFVDANMIEPRRLHEQPGSVERGQLPHQELDVDWPLAAVVRVPLDGLPPRRQLGQLGVRRRSRA